MKASNKTPRPLSQELGIKLSDWTHSVTCYFDDWKDKQEEIFAIIRTTEAPDIINSADEKATIRALPLVHRIARKGADRRILRGLQRLLRAIFQKKNFGNCPLRNWGKKVLRGVVW